MEQTYYQILGVSRTATEQEVKAAWRKLAATEHPDKHGGALEYVAKFQDINKAYETLRDSAKRAQYDAELGGNTSTGSPKPPTDRERTRPGPGGQPGRTPPSGPLNDLFTDMVGRFGGARPSVNRPTVPSGGAAPSGNAAPSGEYKIDVTVEEAFHGAQRSVKVNTTLACPDCQGTGRTQKTHAGLAVGPVACPTCSGKGRKTGVQVVPVNVKPGVYEGAKLQPPGTNLLVTVHIKKDDRYTLVGKDITVDVPVPYTVLVLGGEVQVPTLAGNMPLPIPAGTQGGQKVKMPGLGLPALGSKPAGDLYAHITVPVPKSPSPEMRRLLTEVARLNNDPVK